MYGWLWRKLPGGPVLRLCLVAVVAAGVGVLLWYAVFPLIEPMVSLDEVTVRL